MICTKGCDYEGANSVNLKNHLLTHTRNEAFKCPICSFTASKEHYIGQHLDRHHKKKPAADPVVVVKNKKKRSIGSAELEAQSEVSTKRKKTSISSPPVAIKQEVLDEVESTEKNDEVKIIFRPF